MAKKLGKLEKTIKKSEAGDQWFIMVQTGSRQSITGVYYSKEAAEDYLGKYYEEEKSDATV